MLSASTSVCLLPKINPSLCVGKRRIHNLYHSFVYLTLPSGQSRRTFDSAGSSRLAMPLVLSTFATDFEFSLLASRLSFRKRPPIFYHRYDRLTRSGDYYRLYIIVQSIIRFTRGTFERLARFLSLLLLFLLFSLTLGGRRCVIVARLFLYSIHEAVNNLPQRFDNRLKMSVQCHVLLDATNPQSAMFLVDRLIRLFDPLAIFSRSRTSAMFVFAKISISHVIVSRIR